MKRERDGRTPVSLATALAFGVTCHRQADLLKMPPAMLDDFSATRRRRATLPQAR